MLSCCSSMTGTNMVQSHPTINGLREVINYAKEAVKSDSTLLGSGFGATRGYVLRLKKDELKMTPCWFIIGVDPELSPDKEPKVFFNPIVADLAYELNWSRDHFIYTTISNGLCAFLTNEKYTFGGETVLFRSQAKLDFNLEQPIDPQIKKHDIVARHYPAVCQPILQGPDHQLIIGNSNNTLLELSHEISSYEDEHHRLIKGYSGKTVLWTDSNVAIDQTIPTKSAKALVPVLWVKNLDNYEFFMDIATNWRTSRKGKWISGSAGLFVIRHRPDENGFLTNTSLTIE